MIRSKKTNSAFPLPSPRDKLRGAARRGGITLVLGAGMSIPRGIPDWDSLAKRLWKKVFGRKHSPWSESKRGWSPQQYPQFLPIVFELAYRTLGETKFLETLRKELYAKVKYPAYDRFFIQSNESLAVVARLIVQEYNRGSQRRIDAVVTLNADDIVEQAVNRVAGIRKPRLGYKEIVRVVARGMHSHLGGPARRPIPVYHIHGFLPSNRMQKYVSVFDHMLVFTDAQYWSTSASALTFANRVMASALGEGRCVFIGLSMTDINLLRWLALRTLEKDRDFYEATQRHPESSRISVGQAQIMNRLFERHFWIRPASDDASGFLSGFLNLRGVISVEIKGWKGDSFKKLIAESFPSEDTSNDEPSAPEWHFFTKQRKLNSRHTGRKVP